MIRYCKRNRIDESEKGCPKSWMGIIKLCNCVERGVLTKRFTVVSFLPVPQVKVLTEGLAVALSKAR